MKDKEVKTNNENLEENNLSSNSLDEDKEYDSDDTLPVTPIDGIAQSNICNTDYILVRNKYDEWKPEYEYVKIAFNYDENGKVMGHQLIPSSPNPEHLKKKRDDLDDLHPSFRESLEGKLWLVHEQNQKEGSVEGEKLLGKRTVREGDVNRDSKKTKLNNISPSFEFLATNEDISFNYSISPSFEFVKTNEDTSFNFSSFVAKEEGKEGASLPSDQKLGELSKTELIRLLKAKDKESKQRGKLLEFKDKQIGELEEEHQKEKGQWVELLEKAENRANDVLHRRVQQSDGYMSMFS